MRPTLIFAILKHLGTSPKEKEILNNISRGFDMTYLMIFKILTGILYGPVAFPWFNFEISSSISCDFLKKFLIRLYV